MHRLLHVKVGTLDPTLAQDEAAAAMHHVLSDCPEESLTGLVDQERYTLPILLLVVQANLQGDRGTSPSYESGRGACTPSLILGVAQRPHLDDFIVLSREGTVCPGGDATSEGGQQLPEADDGQRCQRQQDEVHLRVVRRGRTARGSKGS